MFDERDTRRAWRAPDRGTARSADEWWESLVCDRATTAGGGGGGARKASDGGALLVEAGTTRPDSAKRRRRVFGAAAIGMVLAAIGARMSRSARFRRFVFVTAVLSALLAGTALAVGVIVLDNHVIQRSAELGHLERTRRDLRTDNALMSAEIARLSAPPRIVALAHKRLGMTPSQTTTRYIYLDPADRPKPPQRIDVNVVRGLTVVRLLLAHEPIPTALAPMPQPTQQQLRARAAQARVARDAGSLAAHDPALRHASTTGGGR